MYLSAVVVVYIDAGKIQNHRTQRKQVAHQIPTSGRDGGDQTHETTAEDVLRCGALIGTRGVRFGGGVGVFLLPDKRQTLRICLLCSSIFHTFFAPPPPKHSLQASHPGFFTFSPPSQPQLTPTRHI